MTATIELTSELDVQLQPSLDLDQTPPVFRDVGVLFQIQEAHSIYVDAWCADDSRRLVFGSFWGRDTAMTGLLARLSLPVREGGLDGLTLVDCADASSRCAVRMDHAEQLQKLTARMPKANLFGDLVQVWLYDRLLVMPDRATRQAIHLVPETDPDPVRDPALWDLFKSVCHLPVLDPWREPLLIEAQSRGWIAVYPGRRVQAVAVNLGSDEVETTLTRMIQAGSLTLDEPGPERPAMRMIAIPIHREDDGENEEEPDPEPKPRLTAEELRNGLAPFYGTEKWYRHWLVKQMTYTDGVQFFVEEGGANGAYWFLDIVATECFPLLKHEGFLHLKLTVVDNRAELVTEDGNDHVLHRRAIDYTDLQPGTWEFYLTDNVLMLPREY